MCVRGSRVVIVSASSDCSLKLWAPDGMCVGTFGQVCQTLLYMVGILWVYGGYLVGIWCLFHFLEFESVLESHDFKRNLQFSSADCI